MKKGEKRDGSFDVILKAVVKKHSTTQCCFNTFAINELRFLAWVCIDGAVEVAVRLMCAPDVVVEDVGAGPVCGCSQKIQTIQLSELPSRSAMVRATPEDAVGHDIAFSTKIYCVYKIYYISLQRKKKI